MKLFYNQLHSLKIPRLLPKFETVMRIAVDGILPVDDAFNDGTVVADIVVITDIIDFDIFIVLVKTYSGSAFKSNAC